MLQRFFTICFLLALSLSFANEKLDTAIVYVAPSTAVYGLENLIIVVNDSDAENTLSSESKSFIFIKANTLFTAPEEFCQSVFIVRELIVPPFRFEVVLNQKSETSFAKKDRVSLTIKQTKEDPFSKVPVSNDRNYYVSGTTLLVDIPEGKMSLPNVLTINSNILKARRQIQAPLWFYDFSVITSVQLNPFTTRPPPFC